MTKKEKNFLTKTEKLPASEVRLDFLVPAVEFENFVENAAKDLAKDLKIDGFRPGKAPKKIIESAIGEEEVLRRGAESTVKKIYVDAVLDNKIEAIGEPKIEIKKIARGNDFQFSAIVGVVPELKMGDWKKEVAEINKEFASKKPQVEEKEVDREVQFLAKQRAKIITVPREARKGDQVELDFEVFHGNVLIENGSAKKQQLVIGEGKLIPGFEDNLLGMKAGEEKEFSLEFPKDYHVKKLAGKKATFKTKLHLVQERQVPEVDDDFAKGIGDFKDLEELKGNIRKGIEHEQKHKKEDEQKNLIVEKILEKTETEIPMVLIEREVEAMKNELKQDISRMGMNLAQYLGQIKKTEEDLEEQWRKKEAPKRVKAALVLREIAKEQRITAESKEIEDRVNQILQYYGNSGDVEKKVDMPRLYESVKGSVVNEKVFEYLMKIGA